MEKLDQAWDKINTLGGRDVQDNSYDQGIVDTVRKALEIIEALGGMDPKQRQLARVGG
ncbi:MAG: hypothetical protein JWR80_10028 [Bradyrhizobium sp.]|nr:hypothetical protein [Bradyrhizobium sp.]